MSSHRLAAAVFLVAAVAAPASAVVIRCENAAGFPGGQAALTVGFTADEDEAVAGTQNDLGFDAQAFAINPTSDCVINPAIGSTTEFGKQLFTNAVDDQTIRAIVVSLENDVAMPSGALYTCTFDVPAGTALGEYPATITRGVASNPEGNALPVTSEGCVVAVGPTPTPTPGCNDDQDCPTGEVCVGGECVEPTPTSTPIGFCEDDEDCPDGEICVDNRCVTPTPTATPIGFCDDNDDCPEGQVCVDDRCVTVTPTGTPTPLCRSNDDCPGDEVCVDGSCVTPTPGTPGPTAPVRRGDGGGCSCEIDPGAGPRGADGLAVLLPALVLVLRWRARQGRR